MGGSSGGFGGGENMSGLESYSGMQSGVQSPLSEESESEEEEEEEVYGNFSATSGMAGLAD